MKRVNTLLLGLGLAFLAYLVWRVGWDELWHQIRALGWGLLLLVLAEGLGNLAHATGWRYCIHDGGGRVSLLRLFQMSTAGYAINYLTPTASVGGDVSRASLLALTYRGTQSVTSVLLDKLMTAIAHLLLVAGGAFFLLFQVRLPGELWIAMIVTTVLLTVGMGTFFWLQKAGQLGLFFRWLARHRIGGKVVQQAESRISEVDEALKRFYREHPGDLVLSVSWHAFGHLAALLHAWLFLRLLGQPAPATMVAAAGLLSLWFDLLTFVVPLNLGTLEGSRMVIFKALGCQALLGMAFGVAVRAAQLFWACFGLASYARIAAAGSKSGPGREPTALAPFDGQAPNLQHGIRRSPEDGI